MIRERGVRHQIYPAARDQADIVHDIEVWCTMPRDADGYPVHTEVDSLAGLVARARLDLARASRGTVDPDGDLAEAVPASATRDAWEWAHRLLELRRRAPGELRAMHGALYWRADVRAERESGPPRWWPEQVRAADREFADRPRRVWSWAQDDANAAAGSASPARPARRRRRR